MIPHTTCNSPWFDRKMPRKPRRSPETGEMKRVISCRPANSPWCGRKWPRKGRCSPELVYGALWFDFQDAKTMVEFVATR
ncbi:hypothetical protein ACFX2J_003390 [Malus domestica]